MIKKRYSVTFDGMWSGNWKTFWTFKGAMQHATENEHSAPWIIIRDRWRKRFINFKVPTEWPTEILSVNGGSMGLMGEFKYPETPNLNWRSI